MSRYSSYSRDADSDLTSSSRYSSQRYNPVASPVSVRRTYTTPSYSSRYIPGSSSRWAHTYSDEDDEEYSYRRRRHRESPTVEQSGPDHERLGDDHGKESDSSSRVNQSKKPNVTVLNEGAVIIRRQGRADTSDEESDEEPEPVPEMPKTPSPPPRDPLDVEEEMLNEKLQTAGKYFCVIG